MRKPKFQYPEQAPPRLLHPHDLPVGTVVLLVSRHKCGANHALDPSHVTDHTPEAIQVRGAWFAPSAPGYWTAYAGDWYIHSVHETWEAASAAQEVVNAPFRAYGAAEDRARAAFECIRKMALPGHLWSVAAAEKRASDLEFLAEQLANCVKTRK